MGNIDVVVGSDQIINIEKMFGPTIFCGLRIKARSEDCKWEIQRQCISQDKDNNDVVMWETICEIDGQESLNFRD